MGPRISGSFTGRSDIACNKQPILASAPKPLVSGLFVALQQVVHNSQIADKRIEKHKKA